MLVPEHYAEFTPTFACEKLAENHGIAISRETLRKRMIEAEQDRLIKEMRIKNISTMETGNKYLPEFMASFNAKFGKPPINEKNMYRELQPQEDLSRVSHR